MWLCIAFVALVVLQQAPIPIPHGRVGSGLGNGVHGTWFAVLTAVVYALVGTRLAAPRALTVTACIGVLMALGTEVAQIGTQRAAQWQDVVFDLFGGTATLLVVAARSGRLPQRTAFAVAFALLAITWWPAIHAVSVQLHRNAIFPELVDFGAYDLRTMLSSDGELRVVRSPEGRAALDVVPRSDATFGLYLDEPVADWREFDTLVVGVTVPDASAPLGANVSIRLRGGELDHVYRPFMLSAGDSEMRVPFRDLFDPAAVQVTAVVVYANPPYEGRRIRVRRMALERAAQGY